MLLRGVGAAVIVRNLQFIFARLGVLERAGELDATCASGERRGSCIVVLISYNKGDRRGSFIVVVISYNEKHTRESCIDKLI